MARAYALALPAVLDAAQRRNLIWVSTEVTRDRYGMAFYVAIHGSHDTGDDRNHHAHVITMTRVLDAKGLGQ